MSTQGREPTSEIEVTPAMIEAGVAELHEHSLGAPLSRLAEMVYLMMETERRASVADAGRGRELSAGI